MVFKLFKQFLTYANSNTSIANSSCGVPQGSIPGPLLFLLYINYLQNASPVLDPIMHVDNTNTFYSNNDLETLFFHSKYGVERDYYLFEIITRFSDRLHDLSVTIPRCYKDVYVNSFFLAQLYS